jgi:PhnB protein
MEAVAVARRALPLQDLSRCMAHQEKLMSDDVAILEVLNQRAQAIHRKDAAAAVGFYGDDVVNFDLAPPLAYRGKAATDPSELQSWFDTWTSPIEVSFAQMEVKCSGDLAFAYGLMHMTGERTGGTRTDNWVRSTFGLQRQGGIWKIVHEHQSFPTKMDGSGLSASDLTPDPK